MNLVIILILDYFQLDIRVFVFSVLSIVVISLTFETCSVAFLGGCDHKKMVPKLYQSPPLVYQRNWMMIKRSACCHHWLQCLRWLEVEMWLLLKRLTSETNPNFLKRVEGFSLFEKGLLGPLLLWMVYLVGKYLLLFSETELPELYSLLVCKVLQAMRFKFWIISF